ncbi:MAG: hypothetical protein CMP91_04440 [Gammaproteobacteria bacterium]|nr:hypothetical protein [Gammaproteobacteria bacterium]MAY01930.1 hypothetical protein [Gammaproteobacteria bacterium]|tara:strand:+ start:915 stop:1331 length:417 start_codon:yes stop_codon:yes gene_type:complete
MKIPHLLLGVSVLIASSGLTVMSVQAQDETAQEERRAAFAERREERQAEYAERWAALVDANPMVAEEIEALRAERQAAEEQRRAEFAAKYPNLAQALEEESFDRRLLAGPEGPSRFEGMERRRSEAARGSRRGNGPRR